MKRVIFTIFGLLVLINALFAQRSNLSPVPMPKNYYLNISTKKCNDDCLSSMLASEMYFDFLSVYPYVDSSDENKESFRKLANIFGLDTSMPSGGFRIAVLVPQKTIRQYAVSTINTTTSYLLTTKDNFEMEVFNSNDELEDSLKKALDDIRKKDYKYVIAPITSAGLTTIMENSDGLVVYIPTLNRSVAKETKPNIIFGGIDYDAQILELFTKSNEQIATFSDGSTLGKSLDKSVSLYTNKPVFSKEIKSAQINFKPIMQDNKDLNGTSIYLNTPLITTSLIASQLRSYGLKPYALLSTQINYHPMILELTQYSDRENLIIANSIGESESVLRETNSLFGHSIEFDWVNYATSIGINHFFTTYYNPKAQNFFNEKIENSQVKYGVNLMKTGRYSFIPLDLQEPQEEIIHD